MFQIQISIYENDFQLDESSKIEHGKYQSHVRGYQRKAN